VCFVHAKGVRNGRTDRPIESFHDLPKRSALAQARSGLARPAVAGGPSFVPGISLKFLVCGKPSVNTLAIESFEGQGDDLDYFHAVTTNIVPWPNGSALRLVTNFFKLVKEEPNQLQLTNIASISLDGSVPAVVNEPYQIQYRPHGDLATTYGNDERTDFRAVLRRINAGTVLYDVYVRPSEVEANFVLRCPGHRGTRSLHRGIRPREAGGATARSRIRCVFVVPREVM
jgi:hypothetical protein